MNKIIYLRSNTYAYKNFTNKVKSNKVKILQIKFLIILQSSSFVT